MIARLNIDQSSQTFIGAVEQSDVIAKLALGTLPLEWTAIDLLVDDPAKGLGRAPPETWLVARLQRTLGTASRQLMLASPYFVPGRQGVERFSALARSGVQIRIWTNSLGATDVPIVHAGYAHRRAALPQEDIQLYEMQSKSVDKRRVRPTGGARMPRSGTSSKAKMTRSILTGSPATALHAKVFAIDDRIVFIGSVNVDPRSERLNTEVCLLIRADSDQSGSYPHELK